MNNEKITVVSFFDGMSCGQIALNRLGIEYDNYFASEIDKYAIGVTQYNYPNTIQIGDIRNITYKDGILSNGSQLWNIGKVDLIFGGFSCQSLSFANNTHSYVRLESNSLELYLKLKSEGYEFKGMSYLFWELLRLKHEIEPTYFLFENVVPKNKSDLALITNNVGVQPHLIDSRYFSAQKRRRYYWTNIKIDDYVDKGILLSDVLYKDDDPDLVIHRPTEKTINFVKRKIKNGWVRKLYKNDELKSECLLATDYKRNQEYIIKMSDGTSRFFSLEEKEKLQTVPVGYTKYMLLNGKISTTSGTQRTRMLGNGWTVDVISHILKNVNKVAPVNQNTDNSIYL